MIFLGNLRLIENTKYEVIYINYMPFDMAYGLHKSQEELEKEGVFVDSLPVENPPQGYMKSKTIVDKGTTPPTVLYEYDPIQADNATSQQVQNPSTLDDYKKNKMWELEQKCTEIKDGGFKSSCLGTEKTFDSSSENRTLVMGLAMKASLIANGTTLPDSSLDWKAKDEPICYAWTPQQMIILGVDLSTFMTNTIKHKEQLQQYVNILTTVEDVQKITWDTVIPTTV